MLWIRPNYKQYFRKIRSEKGVLFCIHLHTLKTLNCKNLIIYPSPPAFQGFYNTDLGTFCRLLVTHFKINEITSYECLLTRMLIWDRRPHQGLDRGCTSITSDNSVPDPNLEIRRGGEWSPRPLDKVGGGAPKNIFSVWSKIIGGGDRAPRAPPSATATFMGNGKEIEPKELRGCSIPHLLITYTRHLDVCDSPATKSNRL